MQTSRSDYATDFFEFDAPEWVCSFCKKGIIKLTEERLTINETNESKADRKNPKWNLHWIEKHFFGSMQCSNAICSEVYSIAGQASVHEIKVKDKSSVSVHFFHPEYIHPVIYLFPVSEEIPYNIEEALLESFKLHRINLSACANSIRSCIEIILTDKKIVKTRKSSKGKRMKLSLHDRIELFRPKNASVADCLMAVKWIGNAGSHDDTLTEQDIVHGFEILKFALDKLYSTHEENIVRLSKRINKRKKPIS